MTIRQHLGAVVCFFKGCAIEFDGKHTHDKYRWYCPRCGWEEYTLTAEAAWKEQTKDWGGR
jgi:hypothetical protein